MNTTTARQEEIHPNEESPTIVSPNAREQQLQQQVATVNKETNTEIKEDTPLYSKILQKVLGINFIAAATRKDRNKRPLVNFLKKRDWGALKCLLNIRYVRDDCLLIDERIVLPTHFCQTMLDNLHPTHHRSTAMLDLCQHAWLSSHAPIKCASGTKM